MTVDSVPIWAGFNFADGTFHRFKVAFRALAYSAEVSNESHSRRKQNAQDQLDIIPESMHRNFPPKESNGPQHTTPRSVCQGYSSADAILQFREVPIWNKEDVCGGV
jgi:hypothetical protein